MARDGVEEHVHDHHACLPIVAQLVDLFSFIQEPSFSTMVRLCLSIPPWDWEWRGFPCTTTSSGQRALISVMTSPMN